MGMSLDPIRAQQALAILEQLERLPAGRSLSLVHLPDGRWAAFISHTPADHRGSSATDALGQLTTVLALEAQ